MTFEAGEGAKALQICLGESPRWKNSQCKGPGVESCLACLVEPKERGSEGDEVMGKIMRGLTPRCPTA